MIKFSGNKESKPTAINIMVRPVDDELPVLVNNTGLIVWEGATTLLDANQLGNFNLLPLKLVNWLFLQLCKLINIMH